MVLGKSVGIILTVTTSTPWVPGQMYSGSVPKGRNSNTGESICCIPVRCFSSWCGDWLPTDHPSVLLSCLLLVLGCLIRLGSLMGISLWPAFSL